MYFWKTNKLVEDFNNGNVSQKDTMKYLLVISLFSLFLSFLSDCFPAEELSNKESTYLYVEYLFIVLITIVGIYFCYKKNEKIDSSNFIERFVCFSLSAGIKSAIFTLIYFIGRGIIHDYLNPDLLISYFDNPSSYVKLNIFYEVLFYLSVYNSIGKLKQQA